jgi:hypothetical protein
MMESHDDKGLDLFWDDDFMMDLDDPDDQALFNFDHNVNSRSEFSSQDLDEMKIEGQDGEPGGSR